MNSISPSSRHTFYGASVPDLPQISIVTPTYNGLPYLKEAIASVEELADILRVEHVVADGASCDGSVELLANAPYVRGVSQPDNGLYSAANWAIEQARAPYIQWLNADDRLCPAFTNRAIDLLDSFPHIDAVVGSTAYIDGTGQYKESREYDPFRVCDPWARLTGYFFNINSAVYRTKLFRGVGKFDQHGFPVSADMVFQMKFIEQNPHIVVLDEPAYIFRLHDGSLTKGINAEETKRRSNLRLFKAWSQDPTLHPDLRRGFEVMAVELRMGWALKCLRTGKGYGRIGALRELRDLFAEHPEELRAAVPLWARKQLGRVA